MSYTIRDTARTFIPERIQEVMEEQGFIGETFPDGLDQLIEAIEGRVWAKAENAVGEHAEQWHLDHLRLYQDPDMAPEYAQGVHAGLGLAQKVLGREW